MDHENVLNIILALKEKYPDCICSLQYSKDYELLFATRLSAQCTDERVNLVTSKLFEQYPTLESFAEAEPEDIEVYVRPCGFFHAKSRDIVQCARTILNNYGGKVPSNMEDLLHLQGVGRKTANLILGDIYKMPGAVVADTHCIRISGRLGMTDGTKDPCKVETQLKKILPPNESNDFCHRLVLHGRSVCTARQAKCEICCLTDWCSYAHSKFNR